MTIHKCKWFKKHGHIWFSKDNFLVFEYGKLSLISKIRAFFNGGKYYYVKSGTIGYKVKFCPFCAVKLG